MADNSNRRWHLARRPVGMLQPADFSLETVPRPVPGEGEVLIRTVYLSLDPAIRHWVNEQPTFMPPVALGEVMRGFGIGAIEASKHAQLAVGDLVSGLIGWQEWSVSDGTGLTPLPKNGVPLTAHLAVFGIPALAAYFGLLEVGKPQPGETLLVSAAAGAVGALVGQIGKIKGCRVVGTAGSDEKCEWITGDLGFDGAVNYKAGNVLEAVREACPDGVDVYFDNTGGEVLDAVFELINQRARIVQCGMISQYNSVEPVPGPYGFINLHFKRARVEGFICLDYLERAEEAMTAVGGWMAEGRIKYRVDTVPGIEQAPAVVNRIFDGSASGKLVLEVSEEPS